MKKKVWIAVLMYWLARLVVRIPDWSSSEQWDYGRELYWEQIDQSEPVQTNDDTAVS